MAFKTRFSQTLKENPVKFTLNILTPQNLTIRHYVPPSSFSLHFHFRNKFSFPAHTTNAPSSIIVSYSCLHRKYLNVDCARAAHTWKPSISGNFIDIVAVQVFKQGTICRRLKRRRVHFSSIIQRIWYTTRLIYDEVIIIRPARAPVTSSQKIRRAREVIYRMGEKNASVGISKV